VGTSWPGPCNPLPQSGGPRRDIDDRRDLRIDPASVTIIAEKDVPPARSVRLVGPARVGLPHRLVPALSRVCTEVRSALLPASARSPRTSMIRPRTARGPGRCFELRNVRGPCQARHQRHAAPAASAEANVRRLIMAMSPDRNSRGSAPSSALALHVDQQGLDAGVLEVWCGTPAGRNR